MKKIVIALIVVVMAANVLATVTETPLWLQTAVAYSPEHASASR